MAWAENEEGEDGKGLAEEKEEGNARAVEMIVVVVVMALSCSRKNGQR